MTFGILKNSNLGYNHAFGKNIRNRQELKDTINEYKDRTGQELIEVGNENITSYSKKIHRNKFEWGEKDRKQAYDMLDKAGVKD